MKKNRPLGLDGMPIDYWAAMNKIKTDWFTQLFNKIFLHRKNSQWMEKEHFGPILQEQRWYLDCPGKYISLTEKINITYY